jgi:hypothetical protein
MVWNPNTNIYEIETEQEVLQRLVDSWNKAVPNANLTINDIAGSGLEGAFYTYLHGYYTFLQSGVVDLEQKMVALFLKAEKQLLRPPVVKDNIQTFAKNLGENMVIWDANDKKMEGIFPESTGSTLGVYLVFDTTPDVNNVATIFKNCIVAGVKTYGNQELETTLTSGQIVSCKYTTAELVADFQIRVRIKRRLQIADQTSTILEVKTAIESWYNSNYKLGMDFNPTDINRALPYDFFPDFSEIICDYSLNGGTIYNQGTYIVPYNKKIKIVSSIIAVEITEA